jgi:hypothetical protein
MTHTHTHIQKMLETHKLKAGRTEPEDKNGDGDRRKTGKSGLPNSGVTQLSVCHRKFPWHLV